MVLVRPLRSSALVNFELVEILMKDRAMRVDERTLKKLPPPMLKTRTIWETN
jgi:hypothetical protein